MKEIYNLYFGKRIISTEKDINKNITYGIDENIDEYYEVARNFLILDYESKHTYSDVIYQDTKDLVNDEVEYLDF